MNVFRRCRPQLGTFVEVTLLGSATRSFPKWASELAANAFAEIEQVGSAMSFHDRGSQLSGLNRAPVGRWVRIGDPLREVLSLALELQRRSDGRFNVAIGNPLMAWGFLPGRAAGPGFAHLSAEGFALKGNRARRLLPVRIDLGGIAKGYAVDRAVEMLQTRAPGLSGCVNAGGDLRVFGPRAQTVWVRAGAAGRISQRRIRIRDQAIATSTVQPRDRLSAYVDIAGRRPSLNARTAVVRAPRCAVADALTKVALLMPQNRARKLVAGYGGEMSLLP